MTSISRSPAVAMLHAQSPDLYDSVCRIVSKSDFSTLSPTGLHPVFSLCEPPAQKAVEAIFVSLTSTTLSDLPLQRYTTAVKDIIAYAASVEQGSTLQLELANFQESSKQIANGWIITVKYAISKALGDRRLKFQELLDRRGPSGKLFEEFLSQSLSVYTLILPGKVSEEGLREAEIDLKHIKSSEGHYLIVIRDQNDPNYLGLYVGQAERVRPRLMQHQSNLRACHAGNAESHPQMIYRAWMQESRHAKYVVLHRVSQEGKSDADTDRGDELPTINDLTRGSSSSVDAGNASRSRSNATMSETWRSMVEMAYRMILCTLQPDTL